MPQLNRQADATGIMNGQQHDQASQALYSYCKVMSVPKLGAAQVAITVLVGFFLCRI